MALCALSGDELDIVLSRLFDPFNPFPAVHCGSITRELRKLTQALRQQLKAEHIAALSLCRKAGMRSCKEVSCYPSPNPDPNPDPNPNPNLNPNQVREATVAIWYNTDICATGMRTLGKLGSVLPALEVLRLGFISPGAVRCFDGVQGLAIGLGAGALPALTELALTELHVGHAGASALGAALGRGALPRLTRLFLGGTAITDAGLVALAPALRRLPALDHLVLWGNPFGDEGLAALVAPPPPLPAGALSPPTGVLTKLKTLDLSDTKVADAGCNALAAALGRGSLPALHKLNLQQMVRVSAAATARVLRAAGLQGVDIGF
eukprot:scaffold6503_cov60-Phaeocystis_antarctica.AAC.3